MDGQHLQPVGQGGLRGVVRGDEQAAYARPFGRQRHGQHPGHRAQPPVQGQLAHKGGVPFTLQGELAPRAQNAHQNGQVVHRARLAPAGGGQVHGNAGDGEVKAAGFDCRAHPLPGLLHGGVGQAHHVEGGQAAGQGALGGHRIALHPVQPQGGYIAYHGRSPLSCVVFNTLP